MEGLSDLFTPDRMDGIYATLTSLGVNLLAAIAIFIIGRWIARWLSNAFERGMRKAGTDEMLVGFLRKLVFFTLLTFVVLAAISRLGVQTTSFIAVLGAAGLAIGLALQGSLANFAAGVLIIIFRPFKLGDFVEAGGVAGIIEAISVFTTTLRTPDNKTIIIPNGQVMADTIVNYSTKDTRRVDLVVGCGYGDDLDKVRRVIDELLEADARVLKDPAPKVAVMELADSSVNFVVRPWVKSADYWPVYFDLTEKVKKRFDEAGISIPFPQQDVHIHQVAS